MGKIKTSLLPGVCLLAMNLLCVDVAAKDIYVSSTGDDSQSGTQQTAPVKTIGRALQLVANGDVIHVMDMIDAESGDFFGPNLAMGKSFTIVGDAPGAGLDGGGNGRILQIRNNGTTYDGVKITMKNLTIQNGSGDYGGAMSVGNIDAEFDNCKFINNKATAQAGAIQIEDVGEKNSVTNVVFNRCLFLRNRCDNEGGALYITNNKPGSILNIRIVNSTFYGNTAKGISVIKYTEALDTGSSFEMINCTVKDNTWDEENRNFGGINFAQSTKYVKKKIFNCIIEHNRSAWHDANGDPHTNDLVFNGYTPVLGEGADGDLELAYSYVAHIQAEGAVEVPMKNKCFVNYDLADYTGLATPYDKYIEEMGVLPIYDGEDAATAGNALYLQQLDINTDQLGNKRPFTDGKCAVGAVEKTVPVIPDETKPSYNYTHIIINGQSLSTGHQSWPAISTENVPGNYMMGSQVWINYSNSTTGELNPLVSKVAAPFVNDPHSRVDNNLAECPVVAAANHIKKANPGIDRTITTSVGTSGMSIEQLSKESETTVLYQDFLSALNTAMRNMRKENSTVECPAIFWMQGEFNYDPNPDKGLYPGVPNTTSKNGYKELLIKLKNNMQDDVVRKYGQSYRPVLITYQTGAQYVRDSMSISMAQVEAANEYDDIYCAGPVYQMPDRGGHLDPNGYRWYGEMLGKVYQQVVVEKKDFKPLQPVLIKRGNKANQVIVKYHVPCPPLKFDTNLLPEIQNYGFAVYTGAYNSKQREVISSVEITADDEVTITCNNSLAGKELHIMYASNNVNSVETIPSVNKDATNEREKATWGHNGHGNLRDSDPAKGFYTYVDLDAKNPDGTFVYDHDAGTPSLRPNYEQKGEDGQPLYGKPYPLYNFSVAFYYRIGAEQNEWDTTGINDTVVEADCTDNNYYNLSGQRINKPEKGLFIHKGKVVLKK
jgi:hypothetical protein